MHGWTRHAGSKYWLGVWKLLANSPVSRNKTNGGRYVLERFVFPARSEEWVAVAEVRVAKRFYSSYGTGGAARTDRADALPQGETQSEGRPTTRLIRNQRR